MKDCASDVEILKIHQQINRESRQQDSNIIIKMQNTEKQDTFSRIETQSHSNRNTTTTNATEQLLTHEEKTYIEIIKKILSEK